jgi:hypothetical protein
MEAAFTGRASSAANALSAPTTGGPPAQVSW